MAGHVARFCRDLKTYNITMKLIRLKIPGNKEHRRRDACDI